MRPDRVRWPPDFSDPRPQAANLKISIRFSGWASHKQQQKWVTSCSSVASRYRAHNCILRSERHLFLRGIFCRHIDTSKTARKTSLITLWELWFIINAVEHEFHFRFLLLSPNVEVLCNNNAALMAMTFPPKVSHEFFPIFPISVPVPSKNRKVNKSYRGRSCPILVHCNDGIGRTGTYCLIDMVLNRMAKGKHFYWG